MTVHIKLIEKRICKRRLYKGSAVNFNVDTIRLPNGKAATREYLDHPGAVAVLPVLENGDIVLVRQYRYPIEEVTWEIPAGKMHGRGDNPLKRAAAELAEETGYRGRLKKMLDFWPCCTFSNERLHIYSCTDMRRGSSCPDEDEFLCVKSVPFAKAFAMVKSGAIRDAKTVIALLAWQCKYK
ncbi:MAG: NUDIX hydrolase [Elusimicrobiales bacterium]